ncbi:hypothetical protein F8160_09535 [Bacillus sp. CH126_4D]|uniref:hypothetical protein n=1 Tax=unclassified Bacillus (in: firmicutes) TaxID=185979 RepID=UPI00124C99B7|nr:MULTISPECIES: hypothetical protein [unclassified Bacillus (in: firmicutes)]KAB2454627.1 hypothetical protein F8162_17970 [Bacillus sp. CH140a_4T]KAB2473609.1 hypothetical protein F8160_09535 [Bacillus sp. CH126_4D]
MQVKDYNGMLRMTAVGSAVILFLCFIYLKYQTGIFDNFIKEFPSVEVEIKGVKLSTTYILPPLVWMFISLSIRVHDRISDLFKIRKNFDCNHILLPFTQKLNIPLNDTKKLKLFKNREDLMAKIFYKYADSTKTESEDNISPHLIHKALNNWAYFWILLEGQIFIGITIIIYICQKDWKNMLITLIVLILTLLIQFLIYKDAKKIVNQEINAILALKNGEYKERIKKEIKHALQN